MKMSQIGEPRLSTLGRGLHGMAYTRKRHHVCSVNSLNAVSHSYTIQPTLNSNGNFIGECLLVLQEPNGSFVANDKKVCFNLKIL